MEHRSSSAGHVGRLGVCAVLWLVPLAQQPAGAARGAGTVPSSMAEACSAARGSCTDGDTPARAATQLMADTPAIGTTGGASTRGSAARAWRTAAQAGEGSFQVLLPAALQTRRVEPPPEIDADEYAVYRAAIEHMFGDVDHRRYVIRDRTWPYELDDLDYLQDQMPGLSRATHVAYSRRNREAHPLADAFGLPVPVKLISHEEIDEIFGSPEGWDEFYRRYPGSQGEMTLSRVGFDVDRGQALLYLGNMEYWLAGSGWALLFERSGGDWTVVGHAFLWIS